MLSGSVSQVLFRRFSGVKTEMSCQCARLNPDFFSGGVHQSHRSHRRQPTGQVSRLVEAWKDPSVIGLWAYSSGLFFLMTY